MLPRKSNLKQQKRNWLEMPDDVMANILNRTGIVNIIKNAQLVCTTWYQICKDPAMWRVIDADDYRSEISCKNAIDRSKGQLADINLSWCSSHLLSYVADRSSQLRRLELDAPSLGWTDFLMKFPVLEELSIHCFEISKEEIETIGRYCPMLTTFIVEEYRMFREPIDPNEKSSTVLNEIAIAIGQNLPELRHLEIILNTMSDVGLQVILDKCHHLETLYLTKCFNIDFSGDLWEKCSERIKHLKGPHDYTWSNKFPDFDGEKDEYYGINDYDEELCGYNDVDEYYMIDDYEELYSWFV